MSTVFSPEVQRRVRLRNADRFDLSAVLGEPIVVHVGEMPQSQQPKVAEFLNMRFELFDLALKVRRADETPEQAIKRFSEELITADETNGGGAQQLAALGTTRAAKLMGAMQELIGAALLDERGDRMSQADAKAMFDLFPSTPQVAELMQAMANSALSKLGMKPKPKADGTPGDARPTGPEAEPKK